MEEIPEDICDRIWRRFYKEFEFEPSVEPKYWPGIKEPTPSYTISLTESDYGYCPEPDDLIEFFRNAFNQLQGSAKIKYVLDWQHKCYYAPEKFEKSFWVYPDGDYAICLNEDLTCGTFGHPWEQTICVFGGPLIEITKDVLPNKFSKVLRIKT